MDINKYVSPMYTGANVSTKVQKEAKSALDIDDFLKLLSSQLSNQDMMNPNSDTEFIAQLAQFSSVQAMDTMAKLSNISQSTDLVGKTVVVAKYDSNNKLFIDQGEVERVIIQEKNPIIFVNGKEYAYANVQEIKDTASSSEVENAVAMIGKTVLIKPLKEGDNPVQGVVEKIAMVDGSPKLVINGSNYDYGSIMEILGDVKEDNPAETGETPETGETGGSDSSENTDTSSQTE